MKRELNGITMTSMKRMIASYVSAKSFGSSLCIVVIITALHAQPHSPAEPKAPDIEKATSQRKTPSVSKNNEMKKEYTVLVTYFNGSKIRGSLVLQSAKISATCFCGEGLCDFNEAIEQINSIEFVEWERMHSKSRLFRHKRSIITLRDGSRYQCGRIADFDRFIVKRNEKAMFGYTLYYETNASGDGIKKVTRGSKNKQASILQSPPHPDTVQKITFLHEEKKNILLQIEKRKKILKKKG